jgi:hypothetical protein
MLNELISVFAVASSIGVAIGYVRGWIIAVYGAKTPYFKGMADDFASSGRTRNEFACIVGFKLAVVFGVIGCVLYVFAAGILYGVGWLHAQR